MFKRFKQLALLDGQTFKNEVVKSIGVYRKSYVKRQQQQQSKGENSEGKIIGVYKQNRFRGVVKPKRKGKPYNLQHSGEMFRNMRLVVDDVGNDIRVDIRSKGKGYRNIFDTVRKHGLISNPKTIFGLQKENRDELTQKVRQNLYKKLRKYGL